MIKPNTDTILYFLLKNSVLYFYLHHLSNFVNKNILFMKKILVFALLAATIGFTSCNQKAKEDQTAISETQDSTKEKEFQKIEIKDLKDNAYSLFADNWFVVTAGNDSAFNQMTISWGALGHIWQYPSVTIYIRNTRHTYQFLNENKYYTLCAFDEEYRDKVKFIGSHTGSKVDKIKETGLTPLRTELGSVYYKEARLVIECEKMYTDKIDPQNILDEKAKESYKGGEGDHIMFIGKIVNVWEKK